MRLTPYGRREWLAITVICAIPLIAFIILQIWWAVGATVLLWLVLVSFFRDPSRRIPTDLEPGVMLSPADGIVSKVMRLDRHECTGGPAQLIRIFLSVAHVHVNRMPCDCEVVAIRHSPGKFINAMKPESAFDNEANLITLRMTNGETMGLRQVAGMVARRIVCPIHVGDRFQRGERFGMIKFGSTAEVILPRPDDVDVNVKEGDSVKGGLTRLATLKMPAAAHGTSSASEPTAASRA